jgi:S-adenosylmethionine hydrolase
VPRRITLLTDFGSRDGYVAAMRGVIATLAPAVIVDSITDDIPPGDIRVAAGVLTGYWDLYPSGTVHLVVVDPGVGTDRRGIAAELAGRRFVGPDNGVFSFVPGMPSGPQGVGRRPDPDAEQTAETATPSEPGRIVELQHAEWFRDTVSPTFHGRDIFAPVAAHLALGVALDALGQPVTDPVVLERPMPVTDHAGVHGVVVSIDRFGNLTTNIRADLVPEGAIVQIAAHDLPVLRVYGEAGRGELLALIGSTGHLEIARREGSAEGTLGATVGSTVRVVSPPDHRRAR